MENPNSKMEESTSETQGWKGLPSQKHAYIILTPLSPTFI